MKREDVCWDKDDSDEEHYEALRQLPRWQWLGRDGQIEDLRYIVRKKFTYAEHIIDWMRKKHTPNTPYIMTNQFVYLHEQLNRINKKTEAIRKVLFNRGEDKK
jgi:hypothetical protein